MSGLLPRTQPVETSGTFENLNVQTLNVSAAAFINNLVVGDITISDITLDSITVPVINGDPGLIINTSSLDVNGGAILGDTSIIVPAGQFNTINSLANDNTATINGINPLTTNTNLTNHIAATTAHGTTSTIVGINDTQTLTNKNLVDSTTAIVDSVTPSIRILFNASGTAATSTTLTAAQTANRVLTLPDATDTLVGRDTTDTLTNKSLSDLTTSIVNSSTPTKRLAFDTSSATAATVTTLATQQTANRIIFLPDVSGTLVEQDAAQTLTNKTLTSPVISTIINGAGTLTLPNFTTTIVGRSTTDTLTNKTIDSASNTLTITNSPLSGTNVNSLINQDVRTTSTPTFVSGTLSSATVGLTKFNGRYYEVAGVSQTVGAPVVTVFSFVATANHCYMVETNMIGYCSAVSAGGDLNSGFNQRALSKVIVDNASAVTLAAGYGNQFSVGLLTGAGLNFTNSGTTINVGIAGKANDTIDWFWTATVYVI